ncbi:hypothetical protein Ae406Ps2_2492c [Pseudonocardia sp. Ae406_Ps2]|nr:hypothetical protein Ae406Ps2_2492c [Pseudonocardia sp. Ae406_Ps2]OLM12671.1 hypothetical protein Ae505Ps2_2799 [Pseudonocardia sp. Ae505_Ps2]
MVERRRALDGQMPSRIATTHRGCGGAFLARTGPVHPRQETGTDDTGRARCARHGACP